MFGEIACVTLSVYFIKKIRTAIKGNVESGKQPPMPGPSSFQDLNRTWKAGIILYSLHPPTAASVSKEVGPETFEQLTRALANMPTITPAVRQQVHQEFFEQAGLASGGDACKALEQIGKQDPRLLAQMLKKIYLY
jgi:flagellar motor switch protein FliG